MSLLAVAAVGVAAGLDALVGEPPNRLHPVAWFGRLVAPFDRDWPAPKAVGAAVALVLPLLAAGVVAGAVALADRFDPWVGAAASGAVLFAVTSRRMLLGEARTVVSLAGEEPAAARDRLRSLAGRDPTDLSAADLRSAAVESAAENLADGLVAPLLAFALGAAVSLPVAAGAAAWVKAVNTLDSMLGYPEKPVGWASARLDDLVMYVPARATAMLLAEAAGDPGALGRARDWADTPTSPNSGWPMATLSAAVDCRLRKPGTYDLNPDADLPGAGTAEEALSVVDRASLLAFGVGALLAYLAGVVPWP